MTNQTNTSYWLQLTSSQLTTTLHTTKGHSPIYQQPSTAPLHWRVNGLIKFALSTQLEGRDDESLSEPLWLFFPIHLSGTLLKGLASPTLPQLSGYAQLRCNNPNSHSLQFSHFCLHTHLPYVHNHLWRCFFPCLRIRDTGGHAAGWGEEGFTHNTFKASTHHYNLYDKGFILHNSVLKHLS